MLSISTQFIYKQEIKTEGNEDGNWMKYVKFCNYIYMYIYEKC